MELLFLYGLMVVFIVEGFELILEIFRKLNCSNELGNLDLSEFYLQLSDVLLLMN